MTDPRFAGIGMTSARTRDRLVQRLRDQGIKNLEVLDRVRDIAKAGTSVLLAEQNVHKALAVSDRAYVIKLGRLVRAAGSAELLAATDLADAFLGA